MWLSLFRYSYVPVTSVKSSRHICLELYEYYMYEYHETGHVSAGLRDCGFAAAGILLPWKTECLICFPEIVDVHHLGTVG